MMFRPAPVIPTRIFRAFSPNMMDLAKSGLGLFLAAPGSSQIMSRAQIRPWPRMSPTTDECLDFGKKEEFLKGNISILIINYIVP